MHQAPTQTYPPAKHVLRDLQLAVEHHPNRTVQAWIPVGAELLSPSGAPHPGALATLVDAVGGGLAAAVAQPDWIATADLTLHLLGRTEATETHARGHVLRKGRTTVVVEVSLADQGDRALGFATMSFALLPRRDGNPVIESADSVQRMTTAVEGSGFEHPLEEETGLVVSDPSAGAVELAAVDYVRNSLGAVQGGMMAMAASTAAQHALSHACGAAVETVDLQVTYLALAKIGPVRSRVRVLDASPSYGCAHVELVDAGADERVTTLARVVAGRPA
ncbi:MAG: PaaI family thioesterase [Actinobacteria bacterium]|nr:PaaI family thioesterase [Actinomycetota bacterium]